MITTWDHLVEDLRERFGTDAFEDKFEEPTRLQQTSTVVEYIGRFEALLNEVDNQDEKSLIIYFGGACLTTYVDNSRLSVQVRYVRRSRLQKFMKLILIEEWGVSV